MRHLIVSTVKIERILDPGRFHNREQFLEDFTVATVLIGPIGPGA